MVLIYNGINLSQYITKYGVTETPRIIEGANAGTSINGTSIDDVVAVKFDPTFTCRVLNTSKVSILWSIINTFSLGAYYTLTYTSANGTERVIQARLSSTGATKVMDTQERTLYDGIVLSFKEK